MNSDFENQGFFVARRLFQEEELTTLHEILRDFHQSWQLENTDRYARNAVNSAYITGKKHLDEEKRRSLFEFIGSNKIMDLVSTVIPSSPAFMNTQLFFDPVNPRQKNYWHRDIQYTDSTIDQQRDALTSSNVVHFRVPLRKEHGVELVPGTNRRWDTLEEFDVRAERNGRKRSDDLSTGLEVPLGCGDLLVFSANMIHRGLYGGDRFAFDIIFCDSNAQLTKFASDDCLPDGHVLDRLQNPAAFANTIRLENRGNA